MDCFGDLKYLTRNDIKKAMKFSEDDLLYASNLKFLVTMKDCTSNAGKKKLTEPQAWLIERNKLSALLVEEDLLEVQHPVKKHKTVDYRNIVLIRDRQPRFFPVTKSWFNLGVYFFLPKQARIILVSVHNCFSCFAKPQQANIVSWFVHYLYKHSNLKDVYIPLCLKQAGQLVGPPSAA